MLSDRKKVKSMPSVSTFFLFYFPVPGVRWGVCGISYQSLVVTLIRGASSERPRSWKKAAQSERLHALLEMVNEASPAPRRKALSMPISLMSTRYF